ncbi:MAG: hypothetical protein LC722_03015 [Actinobacteria bacterium]|nr:hypothetical protein [Actinomycetota bacterium]
MTRDALVAAGVGAAVAVFFGWGLSRPGGWPVRRQNHRGERLPVALGVALAVGLLSGDLAGTFPDLLHRPLRFGVLLLVGVGFLDDWRGGDVRGIRGHVRSLLRGRITTGILKIVAGFVAAGFAVHTIGGSVVHQVIGVFVIAGATNIWNVLDVAPGRALKIFIPAEALQIWFVWPSPHISLLAAALGAVAGLLWFDLRERAMLGDAGSNPLGFLVGVGLYLALPTVGLAIAFVVILWLQFLAETITLSRVIQAVAPLRWFDGLFRVRRNEKFT